MKLGLPMLLPRTYSSSAIFALHLPIMHMLLVEAPLFFSAVIVKSPAYSIFKTFELSSVSLKLLHSKLTIFNVYHPPPATTKTRKSMPFSLYIFISLAATTPHEFLITGDFNLHLYHPHDPQVKQFLAALDSTNLTQHVSFPTHRDNHILDLVITPTSSSLNPVIDHRPITPSDHLPTFSSLSIWPSIPLL